MNGVTCNTNNYSRIKFFELFTYKIRDRVEMILEEDQIVIRPSVKPRQGWSEAFETMNENGDDKLLIQDIFDDEDPEEWKQSNIIKELGKLSKPEVKEVKAILKETYID